MVCSDEDVSLPGQILGITLLLPLPQLHAILPQDWGRCWGVLAYTGGASLIGVQLPVRQYCRMGLSGGTFER